MSSSVDDSQRIVCDQLTRFAQRELNPGARERDGRREFSRELWLKCGESRIHGLPVPLEHGGAGLDAVSTALALEAFGKACEDGGLAFSICAHMLACVVPIWRYGSEAQKRQLLPALASGRLIAVNAMTEPDGGSDPFAMKTRALVDAGGFVLSGTKTFASNGPVADLALVYASTDPTKGFLGGVTAFLVRSGPAGFTAGRPMETLGLRTCPMGEIVFDRVRVDEDAVLGPVGGGGAIFARSMEWERACLSALHVGEMERLLERAAAYARTRTIGGKPIGKLQAVAHKLADMKVRLEAARLLSRAAAAELDRGGSCAGMSPSVAKLFASEALVASALDAIQVLGGYGFTVEADVERTLRDAVGSTLYSGTSEVQRNIIAHWMGL